MVVIICMYTRSKGWLISAHLKHPICKKKKKTKNEIIIVRIYALFERYSGYYRHETTANNSNLIVTYVFSQLWWWGLRTDRILQIISSTRFSADLSASDSKKNIFAPRRATSVSESTQYENAHPNAKAFQSSSCEYWISIKVAWSCPWEIVISNGKKTQSNQLVRWRQLMTCFIPQRTSEMNIHTNKTHLSPSDGASVW